METLPIGTLEQTSHPVPSLNVEPGDIFLCIGSMSAYKALFRFLN